MMLVSNQALGCSPYVSISCSYSCTQFSSLLYIFTHMINICCIQYILYIFKMCMKVKIKVKLLSCVRLFETPWTVVYQAPSSMGFSRQEYWNGLPCPSSMCVLASTYFLKRKEIGRASCRE